MLVNSHYSYAYMDFFSRFICLIKMLNYGIHITARISFLKVNKKLYKFWNCANIVHIFFPSSILCLRFTLSFNEFWINIFGHENFSWIIFFEKCFLYNFSHIISTSVWAIAYNLCTKFSTQFTLFNIFYLAVDIYNINTDI